MLPCEGGEYDQSAGTANVANYVNAGGRVFTTHYSYDWWSLRRTARSTRSA